MGSALSFDSLRAGYGKRIVLDDVSFDVPDGCFCALTGPNGSGKSTLLKCVTGEITPFSGTVYVKNRCVFSYGREELAKNLAFVAQSSVFPYEFTVRELVSMGRFCHRDMRRSSAVIDEAMDCVGITSSADKLATQISGGEMQLAMLARAVCQDTQVLVLDEPLNNLDLKYQLRLLDILCRYVSEGRTVLCVMHDLELVKSWCGMCVLMKDGKVCSSGKPRDVLSVQQVCSVYGIPACSLAENACHLSPIKIDSES